MINLNKNLSLTLGDYLDKNSKFDGLRLEEHVGGNIPTGTYKCKVDQSKFDYTLKSFKVKLVQADGVVIEFTAYVYRMLPTGADLEIKFLPISDDLVDVANSGDYIGVDSALRDNIESIDTNARSDVNANIKILKCRETSFNFVNRIAKAYKRNAIFAHTFNGLVIRDLDIKNSNFKYNLLSQRSTPMQASKFWSMNTIDGQGGLNVDTVYYNKSLMIYQKDYKQLIENYMFNSRLYSSSDLDITDTSSWISNFTLGDLVSIKSNDLISSGVVLTDRFINIELANVQVTYKFKTVN